MSELATTTSVSIFKCDSRAVRSAGSTISSAGEVTAPIRTRPPPPPLTSATSCAASCNSSITRAARPASTRPASVSTTPRPIRCRTGVSMITSISDIRREAAGWVIPSRPAAKPICPVSANATSICKCLSLSPRPSKPCVQVISISVSHHREP